MTLGVSVEPFAPSDKQMCNLGDHHWSVARLIRLSRDLEVFEAPLRCLNIWHQYEKISLRSMVGHMLSVQAADMDTPIILDEDGELLDGRHRIMRALLEGRDTIKAVRFEKNPSPCRVEGQSL